MRHGVVAVVGLIAFHFAGQFAGGAGAVWLPSLGIGMALLSWADWRLLPVLAIDLILIGLLGTSGQALLVVVQSALLTLQIGLSWWIYHDWLRGSRDFEDPRSATVFLLLVPGIGSLLFGALDALALRAIGDGSANLLTLVTSSWLARALGSLVVLPPLLTLLTPILVKRHWLPAEPTRAQRFGLAPTDWTWGESIELVGLCMGNGMLAVVLVLVAARDAQMNWSLWGISLLLVVWSSLRQGLRGGALCACTGSAAALIAANWMGFEPLQFSPLQGNLLALCSTALLVGSSATWIRTNEARYRHVAGQIPVVLYSARLSRPMQALVSPEPGQPVGSGRPDMHLGPTISASSSILLVSPAAAKIFGCDPENLVGPHAAWLQRIIPDDRELVIAALMQLCLQRQPVTCEYRVQGANATRWLRESLTPFQSEDGMLHGWDSVVEDVTESHFLSQSLRQTSAMLQSLIGNLPMGIFLVHGARGVPLLVNARARQLLGQREEMSAGIAHLSQVYRLRRTDGSPYPAAELPVSRALLSGSTCTASDIVVHRPDGRKTALMCWAAPIELGEPGGPAAAVWVMEDISIIRRRETESRDTEQRLRVVIDAMACGVLVINAEGAVVEANPAASSILAIAREALLQSDPFAGSLCVQPDGRVLPRELQPLARALRGETTGGMMLGLRTEAEGTVRWLGVSAAPLPVGPVLGLNSLRARVVMTITAAGMPPPDHSAKTLESLLAALTLLPLPENLLDLQQQMVGLGQQLLALTKSEDLRIAPVH